MTYLDIIYICSLFFIIGFLLSILGLFFCRLRSGIRRKKKGFHQPAKFVPKNLNLQLEEVQTSVDNSKATDDFTM